MRLGRVYIWRLREFLCAPGNGAEARLVILGAILARESLAPSVASLFLSHSLLRVGACQDWQLTRGIILEFWTPPPPLFVPFSPFLCRFAVNAPPTHPTPYRRAFNVEPVPNAAVRARTACHPDDVQDPVFALNTNQKDTQPLPKSKDHPVLVCVCIRMHGTASLFLPFRPFYASMATAPSPPPSPRRPRSGDIWRQC